MAATLDGSDGTFSNAAFVLPTVAGIKEAMQALESMRRHTYNAIALPPIALDSISRVDNSTAAEVRALADAAAPRLFGMGVMVSKMLNEMPYKTHKRRKWMSLAYHLRIQKKWNKRFGVGPMAILMNAEALWPRP